MDFTYTYTGTITIDEEDLDQIVNDVKSGRPFRSAFREVMAGYDDEDYCNSCYIVKQVEKVINQRLSGT